MLGVIYCFLQLIYTDQSCCWGQPDVLADNYQRSAKGKVIYCKNILQSGVSLKNIDDIRLDATPICNHYHSSLFHSFSLSHTHTHFLSISLSRVHPLSLSLYIYIYISVCGLLQKL